MKTINPCHFQSGIASITLLLLMLLHPGFAWGEGQAGSEEQRQQVQSLQKKMMSDPETLKWIEELKKDPAMQEIAKDEELMRAVDEGDLARVREDPKIQALMKNRTFGKIVEKNQ
jgi:hypothetical protein